MTGLWVEAYDPRRLHYLSILERRLGVGRLAVKRDYWGKPSLNGSRGHFSVAHKKEQGVVAYSEEVPVGVDLEDLRRPIRAQNKILHPREWEEMSALPLAEHNGYVLKTLAKKEALLKAVGVGLSLPLPTLDLSQQRASWVWEGASYELTLLESPPYVMVLVVGRQE